MVLLSIFSMNIHFYLIIVLTICGLTNANSLSRIFGGKRAKEGQFPYQVFIKEWTYDDCEQYICSGSILNEYWIISVASCSGDFAVAGTNLLNGNGIPYKIIEYKNTINQSQITDEYSLQNMIEWNKIGLMKVSKPIEFNRLVQPIEISRDVEVGPLVISGWGVTEYGYPNHLHYATVKKFPTHLCDNVYLSNNYFCLSGYEGIYTCADDFGDPLVYKGKLVGISSISNLLCSHLTVNKAVNVSIYYDWINKIITEN